MDEGTERNLLDGNIGRRLAAPHSPFLVLDAFKIPNFTKFFITSNL